MIAINAIIMSHSWDINSVYRRSDLKQLDLETGTGESQAELQRVRRREDSNSAEGELVRERETDLQGVTELPLEEEPHRAGKTDRASGSAVTEQGADVAEPMATCTLEEDRGEEGGGERVPSAEESGGSDERRSDVKDGATATETITSQEQIHHHALETTPVVEGGVETINNLQEERPNNASTMEANKTTPNGQLESMDSPPPGEYSSDSLPSVVGANCRLAVSPPSTTLPDRSRHHRKSPVADEEKATPVRRSSTADQETSPANGQLVGSPKTTPFRRQSAEQETTPIFHRTTDQKTTDTKARHSADQETNRRTTDQKTTDTKARHSADQETTPKRHSTEQGFPCRRHSEDLREIYLHHHPGSTDKENAHHQSADQLQKKEPVLPALREAGNPLRHSVDMAPVKHRSSSAVSKGDGIGRLRHSSGDQETVPYNRSSVAQGDTFTSLKRGQSKTQDTTDETDV